MKTKVFHVITKLELGGAQKVTLMMLERLPRDRYEVGIVTGPEGILVEQANRIPLLSHFWIPNFVREVRPIQDLRALFQLWRVFRRERPNIVHTHTAKAGILGRLAARLAGVPIIFHTYHGFGFNDFQRRIVRNFYISLERITGKVTTQTVVVSHATGNRAEANGIVRKGDWMLCRAAIPLDDFMRTGPRRAKLREWNIPEDKVIVGMVACFKSQKSPVDFIDVAARVLKETDRAHFVMVGDGELRPAIEARINELGVAGKVTLLGWRQDMPEVYRNMDIVMLTSLWEGLPCVFFEAMACELPIVATDVDGARDAIVEGGNGFLHQPHNIEGMAKSAIRLIQDPALRETMGRLGKSRVMEFDISTSVATLEAAYQKHLCRLKSA
jgi:glycosyltransferase involved in cell wall biosynthesis